MARQHWIEIPGTHEFSYKGKTYRNMKRFERPCATCGKNFPIFVTHKVAEGAASSNSFGLTNCEDHRKRYVNHDGSAPAQNGRVGHVEPRSAGEPTSGHGFGSPALSAGMTIISQNELEQLKLLNRNLTDECNGHLAYIKELEAELATLRAPTVQDVLKNNLPWT